MSATGDAAPPYSRRSVWGVVLALATVAALGLVRYGMTQGLFKATIDRDAPNFVRIEGGQWQAEVVSQERLVVVEFYAGWCNACHTMQPVLAHAANKWREQVKFVKIDFDAEEELARSVGVNKLPAVLFVRGGRVVMREAIVDGAGLDAILRRLLTT